MGVENEHLFQKRGVKMIQKLCIEIYSYRYLIGFYLICLGMLTVSMMEITEIINYVKAYTFVPFLEVIAYQVK